MGFEKINEPEKHLEMKLTNGNILHLLAGSFFITDDIKKTKVLVMVGLSLSTRLLLRDNNKNKDFKRDIESIIAGSYDKGVLDKWNKWSLEMKGKQEYCRCYNC